MAVAYAEECAQPDVELHINEEGTCMAALLYRRFERYLFYFVESNTGPGIESRVFRQPYVGDAG